MSFKCLLVILTSYFLFTLVQRNDAQDNSEEAQLSTAQINIAFDLPDITVKAQTEFGEVQLEAYKAITNDAILKDDKIPKNKVKQLFWVSVGNPSLLSTADKTNTSVQNVFHFTPKGFYATIQMLSSSQSDLLAQAASKKYNITIQSNQIVHLVLSKFECTIDLFQGGQRYITKGLVRDFRNYPLRIDFTALQGSKERKLFKSQLDDKFDLDLDCTIASNGKLIKINTLTITTEESQQLGITEKLFGPTHTVDKMVFVTREQLVQLSAEMYSSLNIVEEYQMPEFQFSESFVEELIMQVAVNTIKPIAFNECLKELSKFGLDFGKDLQPDEITKDLGKIFKLQISSNKTHIIVDDKYLESLKESGKYSDNVSAQGSFKIFSIGGSVNKAKEHSKDWMVDKKNLNDQLSEINSEAKDDIEWTIEGSRIIPKSIKVAKLSRANFGKTLSFKRIVRRFTDAPFNIDFVMYYHKFGAFVNSYEILTSEIRQQTSKVSELSSHMVALDSQMATSINTVNTLSQTTRSHKEESDGRASRLESQIFDSQNKLNLLNEWFGGSYCIFANGYCPAGFTRHASKLDGISVFSTEPDVFIWSRNFGDSYIKCNGGFCSKDYKWANLYLAVCCK